MLNLTFEVLFCEAYDDASDLYVRVFSFVLFVLSPSSGSVSKYILALGGKEVQIEPKNKPQ